VIRRLTTWWHRVRGHVVCVDCGQVSKSADEARAMMWRHLIVYDVWQCLDCRALHLIVSEVREESGRKGAA
jgi:hypothetical protein